MGQSLAIPRVIPNDWKRLDLIVNKIKFKLGRGASPTFTGLTLTGLIASRLIASNASKALESVSDLTSWIAGTANQIAVADDSDGTVTLSITNPLAVPGKVTAGSFSSPLDVTATRQYGFELHYSGNDYDVTGIRSRARLKTTDTTATAQGALLQAANEDGIDAGVLQGALIEAIGKSTTTAATISTMRGALINTEWDDYDTVTNLKTLHVRTHSRNAAGAGSFGTGYGIYIENEAVGGNGQAYDAGIYFKGTNLSAGNKAFTYGIDFSGGTFASEEIKLANGSVIGSNKITLAPTTDSTTFFQILDADGGTPVFDVDTTNEMVGIRKIPSDTLDVQGTGINSNNTGGAAVFRVNRTDGKIAILVMGLIGGGFKFDETGVFNFEPLPRATIEGTTFPAFSSGFTIQGSNGFVGFGKEGAPVTVIEITHSRPYITLHNSTHEDTDSGGESRLISKREDGAGTETACFRFEASHDGSGANDQLGKGIWSVNTGSGLVQALEIGSDLLATFAGSISTKGFDANLVTKTGAYTLTSSDYTVICNATGGAFTITLPTAASHTGRIYYIKKIDSSANAVTVDGDSSETIDDSTTAVLTAQYESITIQSDGSEWWII